MTDEPYSPFGPNFDGPRAAEAARNFAPAEGLSRRPPWTTLGPMATDLTREEIDAKLGASEARSDAKFERMLGEMRTGFAEMRGEMRTGFAGTASKATVVSTAIVLGLGLGALFVAILGFGSAMFGQGFSADAIAHKAAVESLAAAKH